MKKTIFRLTAFMILMTFAWTSNAQELRSSNGSSSGKIDSDGTIRNSSGSSW